MEKENEIKTVVPALRFPEFQGMIGWEKTYIYEECPNPYSGGTPKTTEKKYYGGNIPFIRSAEIGKDKTELSITQEGLNNSSAKMIQKGDLLIALYGANSGDIAISKIDGAINQAILCLKAKSNNLFIYYTLLKKQKDIVSKYLQGGQGNLSGEIIKSIDFYIPQKIEQQKIADCLSSLDDLIEATAQKVDALKEHKKGLMQRLFPADGKNVPDLRFPEFQRTQVWEDAILGTVADYENGKAHENEIDEDGDFIVVNSKFISTDGEVFKRTNTPYCLADKEDILMVLSDVPNGRAIAKCFFVDESGKYTVNQRICRLRSKSINSKFLFYLINRNPYFLSFDDGVKQTNLKKSEVLECPLMVPSSPIEQQKIADLLSSIDDLIIATEQRIKSLEKHKKGLMQQLFPKI